MEEKKKISMIRPTICFRAKKEEKKKPFGSLLQKLYCSLVQNSNHKSMTRILKAKVADFVY